jgi:NHL repeat
MNDRNYMNRVFLPALRKAGIEAFPWHDVRPYLCEPSRDEDARVAQRMGCRAAAALADTSNHRIQKFDASGTFLTTWGIGGGLPIGVATDGSGNVYVADTANNRIQKFACP